MAATAPLPVPTVITVDVTRPPTDQPVPIHNRWHPEIPWVVQVTEGAAFRVEMLDSVGGQVKPDDSPEDIRTLDLLKIHCMSGPIRVVDAAGRPAEPGDLLTVELSDIGPLPGRTWGFTGICVPENGGGFLTDYFPDPYKVIWEFEGVYTRSRHMPGVRFPGMVHPGLIGTAPSAELLRLWNARERALAQRDPATVDLARVLFTRPLATLPTPASAILGRVPRGPQWDRIAAEAARTVPGRENGGNCDIKNLTRGSRVHLPVFVEGANLSIGDTHFSQGDGEVAFCGAIEMAAYAVLKCTIVRGGMAQFLTPVGASPLQVNPIFEISPLEPRFSEWLVFEGVSVDEKGTQHYLDASVAYKRAVINAVNYLTKFGYTAQQAYTLLSCAPCEGRISSIVDIPNACCTMAVPTAIFDQDIRPRGPVRGAGGRADPDPPLTSTQGVYTVVSHVNNGM
jgi:formamidase